MRVDVIGKDPALVVHSDRAVKALAAGSGANVTEGLPLLCAQYLTGKLRSGVLYIEQTILKLSEILQRTGMVKMQGIF